MTYYIAGLGNPGEEYESTRHNAGRIMAEHFRRAYDFPEFVFNKKLNALTSKGEVSKDTVVIVLPETFMNKSGAALKTLAANAKAAERLLVVYDDLDLPFGIDKMSFNKSAGGHRGVDSVIKSIKTEAFPRIRIGISPSRRTKDDEVKIKKPLGEEKVLKHILGKFDKEELAVLKKLSKKVNEAIELWVTEGRAKAMNYFN